MEGRSLRGSGIQLAEGALALALEGPQLKARSAPC